MAQFAQAFDANTVEPSKPMEVLPDGWYPVVISASEWIRTKKNDGTYLELEMSVIDGTYRSRKTWDRLNLDNPNAQAVEIAQKTLSAICHATGVMQVKDSTQLHNIPMLVKLVVKQGEKSPQNEVKGYKKFESVVGAIAPASVAPAANGAPAVAPWLAKKPA